MSAIESDGSVRISPVSRNDAGTYVCIVVNRANEAARSPTELRVVYYDPATPISVTLTPKSRSVDQDTTIQFICNVQNTPDPFKIQWSRQSGQPLPNGHLISGNRLTLFGVQASDSGRYQCSSSNDGAYAADDAYLEVLSDGEGPASVFPVLIQVQNDRHVSNPDAAINNRMHLNSQVKVECVPKNTGGSRLVSVEWSKQAGEGADRHKQERRQGSSTLVFESLTSMDLGTYVCIAQKENGEVAQNEILFSNHGDLGPHFHYVIKVSAFLKFLSALKQPLSVRVKNLRLIRRFCVYSGN